MNAINKANDVGQTVTDRLYQDAADRLERNYFSGENQTMGRQSKLMENAYGKHD
jgi:hypothetical protein